MPCVCALITAGLAFPLLALFKNTPQLGCTSRLALPALIGSSVIIVFSPSLADTVFIPTSFDGHWQHTTAPFNAFVVTTIFSVMFGLPAALEQAL